MRVHITINSIFLNSLRSTILGFVLRLNETICTSLGQHLDALI